MTDVQSRMHANSKNENFSIPTVYSCNSSSANVNCNICNKSSVGPNIDAICLHM